MTEVESFFATFYTIIKFLCAIRAALSTLFHYPPERPNNENGTAFLKVELRTHRSHAIDQTGGNNAQFLYSPRLAPHIWSARCDCRMGR